MTLTLEYLLSNPPLEVKNLESPPTLEYSPTLLSDPRILSNAQMLSNPRILSSPRILSNPRILQYVVYVVCLERLLGRLRYSRRLEHPGTLEPAIPSRLALADSVGFYSLQTRLPLADSASSRNLASSYRLSFLSSCRFSFLSQTQGHTRTMIGQQEAADGRSRLQMDQRGLEMDWRRFRMDGVGYK